MRLRRLPIRRFDTIFFYPLHLLLLPTRNPHLHALSLLLLHLPLRLLIITPHIRNQIHKNDIIRNPQNKEKPEEINTLQASEQGESDVLADPAFILLGVPVEIEGADGAEGGEGGIEDDEVDVVAEVDPDADEEGEEGEDEGGVEVVEGFGGLKKRRANVSILVQQRGSIDGRRLTARKKSLISCVI